METHITWKIIQEIKKMFVIKYKIKKVIINRQS